MGWTSALPQCCQYSLLTPLDLKSGKSASAVHRNLLQMLYNTSVWALHRPRLIPPSSSHAVATSHLTQETSRLRVCGASIYIIRMALELHQFDLDMFISITGVAVVLPAMVTPLLDLQNPALQVSDLTAHRFWQCMCVMKKLHKIYIAADDAIGFLHAALRQPGVDTTSRPPPETSPTITSNLPNLSLARKLYPWTIKLT